MEGGSGLTVEYGETFVANEVVTHTNPAGLEFRVLNTIWEERFTS